MRLFTYVDIVNFNGDDTTVSYKRVLDRNINVVDGTLVFDFKFRMLLTEEKSPQMMKKHTLIKEIKEQKGKEKMAGGTYDKMNRVRPRSLYQIP